MNHIHRMIQRIISDHHIVLFVGIMFILSGLINLNEHALEQFFNVRIELFHNHLFLGGFNVLLAITFLVIGTQNVEMSLEKESNDSTSSDAIKKLEERVAELEVK